MPLLLPEHISPAPFIGLIDSGVGGLSVMREVVARLPNLHMLYYADQAHLPYGPKPHAEIVGYVAAICAEMIAAGAAAIVIPCHSACAAGLIELRERWPEVSFVGIEPAIKPAAEATRMGVVGALMTQATKDGALFRRVVEHFATPRGVQVLAAAAPELVTLVEAGAQDDPDQTDSILHAYLDPMLDAGMDQLVLACTHFPFLAGAIRRVVGMSVTLVDPAPGVARQTERVLHERGIHPLNDTRARRTLVTSGDESTFRRHVAQLHAAGLLWGDSPP